MGGGSGRGGGGGGGSGAAAAQRRKEDPCTVPQEPTVTPADSRSVHHVLELGHLPDDAAGLPDDLRYKFVRGVIKSSKPGGFAENSLVSQAPIKWYEEMAVMLVMLLWLGGPLASFYTFTLLGIAGTWTQFCCFCVGFLVLGLHPLPNLESYLNSSKFSVWTYKYFSFRLMWSDDAMEKIQASPPWMGASGPHAVMPFGSLLDIPAVNMFVFRKFKGGTASVLRYIPMLRYLYLWGAEECSGKNLKAKIDAGYCVGVVSDGIAGIFKSTRASEAFYIKERKALARWCLRNGVPIVPAYSVGNTQAFYSWYDRFGVLEWVSRRTQVALFLYFGRFGLPIPFRCNVTQLLGAPIPVEKRENPSEEEVDALHAQVLAAYVTMFNTHKHALGWGERELLII